MKQATTAPAAGDQVIDPKTGITYRAGSFDDYILRETRCYFPLGLQKGDRVLDLGGHIGCFASRTRLEHEVPVLSIEAEHSNFEILQHNAQHFQFEARHLAVVAPELDGQELNIYVNEKKNNALHSTVPIRGRRSAVVTGVSMLKLMDEFNPTIIKCDIEAAEYALPWDEALSIPYNVSKLLIELHLTKSTNRSASAPALIETIKNAGFRALVEPKLSGKNWATLGIWER